MKREGAQKMDLEKVIKERKAVRHYKENVTIPKSEIEELLRLSSQSPSGHNLQSWCVAVITNNELREKIKPFAHDQEQVVTASALLVFFADTHSAERLDDIYKQDVAEGFLPAEMLEAKIADSHAYHATLTAQQLTENAIIDTSLFAMHFMLLAKAKGYDTVPMRGFSADAIDALVETPANYKPLLLMAIGKSEKEGYGTSRLAIDEFAEFIQ